MSEANAIPTTPEPHPSRRGAIFYGSAVLAGIAAGGKIFPEHDPIIDLIGKYTAGIRAYEGLGEAASIEEDDAIARGLWGETFDEICENTPPIKTMKGATVAIRFLFEECMNMTTSGATLPLLNAVLAYMNTQA